MAREPSIVEQRILDAYIETVFTSPRAANESGPDYILRQVRLTIATMKDPPHEVLDAGREHVAATPAMMTAAWNAMLDKISPEK